MVKFVAIGTLLVLVFAIAFAPAGLTRLALDRVDQVSLLEPSGTLWSGQGRISINGNLLGALAWDLQVVTLFSGALGYDFTLQGQDLDLTGTARANWDRSLAVAATGRVGDVFVNQLMAPYDMTISGDLTLNDTRLQLANGIPQGAGGSVSWDGGVVDYVLSGRRATSRLPAMQARLGEGPEATVFERGGTTPLLVAELQDNGFAKVGITQHLTTLLNNPWPGDATAAAIVLEVEEKIF